MRDPRRPGLVSLATVVAGWDHWIVPEAAAAVARGVAVEQARLRGSRVLVLLDWSELDYDGLLDGLAIHSGHQDITVAEKVAKDAAEARFESMLEHLRWKDAAAEQVPGSKMYPDPSSPRLRSVYSRRIWDGVGWNALEVRARLWSCDGENPIDSELIAVLTAQYHSFETMRHFERAAEAAGQGRAHT